MPELTESLAQWRRTSTPRDSKLNQATLRPASTAEWSRASRKIVLPVPESPHTTRFSVSPPTPACAAHRVGTGMDGEARWGVSVDDPVRHGVMVTVHQLAGRPMGLGQVQRFENLHDLLGMFTSSLLGLDE